MSRSLPRSLSRSLSRSLRAGIGAVTATLIATAMLFVATPSGAEPLPMTLQPTGGALMQVGSGSVTGVLSTPCDSTPSAADIEVLISGVEVPAVKVTPIDPSTFTIEIPPALLPIDVLAPPLAVDVLCPVDSEPTHFHGEASFAEMLVSALVLGEGPRTVVFTVRVTCTDGFVPEEDATGATPALNGGGSGSVVFQIFPDQSVSVFLFPRIESCVIDEIDSAGAVVTHFAPSSLIPIEKPARIPVAILHEFPVVTNGSSIVTNESPLVTAGFTG